MKKLLIAFAALLIPVVALAGNTAPTLYLEAYREAPPADPAPAYICGHEVTTPPVTIPCYVSRVPYTYVFVPIHIAKLDEGFLGVTYGVSASTDAMFMYQAIGICPNFLQGPGTAPGDIVVTATDECRDWPDHPCYLKYFDMNMAGGALYFNIINNTYWGYTKVMNCESGLDDGTVVGGGIQVGGTQTLVCASSPTPVNESTWGKIKGLYR